MYQSILTTLVVWSLIVSALLSLASAQLNSGNILVIDQQRVGKHGALFSVNPATASRTIISDFNNPAQGELGGDPHIGGGPRYVAIDASGNILVSDPFKKVLFKVNPTNGFRTILSDFFNPLQGNLGFPEGITFDVDTIFVVGDFVIGGNDPEDALFKVDAVTGSRTLITNFHDSNQGPVSKGFVENLAIDPNGNILVMDEGIDDFHGALHKVDPTTGRRTIVSEFDNPMQGVLGIHPTGVAVDASGDIWVVDPFRGRGFLFRINPTTGHRTVVSDFGNPMQGVLGAEPIHLAIDASGNILITDMLAGPVGRGLLFSVNPITGDRTVVTDFGDRAQGELGEDIWGVAVAPTLPMQPVDLTITNMEITQGIQNFANDVPLVQDKTTYVRVYPKVDIADRRVGARLRGFRGGVELPGSPLRPLSPFVTVHTGGASRATLNDSFNFLVPPAWRSGLVSFQAEINFGGAIPETDTNNNVFSLLAEFIPKAPVCVVMIPVRTHGSLYTVDSPGFDSIIARFESLWPVPSVWVYSQSEPVEELQARFGIPPWEFGPYELTEGAGPLNGPADRDKVIVSLVARALFTDDPDECGDSNARTHYVGMVSPDTNTGTRNGRGPAVLAAAWVKMRTTSQDDSKNVPFSTPWAGTSMAHELAHNYNGIGDHRWSHVDCGRPSNINPDYPYPAHQIGPVNPNLKSVDPDAQFVASTFWGFDPLSNSLIPPNEAADFMSYCKRWVSDYTWTGLFDEINPLGGARVQALGPAQASAVLMPSTDILVLGGVILPTANVANFEYAYRLPQGTISTHKMTKLQSSVRSVDNTAGAYVLELVDVNEAVLFSQPFDAIDFFEDSLGQVFFLIVPFTPNTIRIRVTQNGQALGALTVSAHVPQVQLFQPSGGEMITDHLTIQWEGSDQDNDTLFYTVQYSADLGATWHVLITQTPTTTLTLEDIRSLPGSTQRSLIRVLANDGVNTGSATSGPFTVQSRVPVAHIDSPSNQSIFALNSQIVLMGGARDAEDGPLGDAALTWRVNGQLLGSGKEAAVGGLAPGTYTITLEAIDSDHNTAVVSVTITIVAGTPVASADSYSTRKNTPLTVVAPGVLGNDIDAEGDPLSTVLTSTVRHGTLTLNADGAFTYTPQANFRGADSFTYTATDGTADSNAVTVRLTAGEVTFPELFGDLDSDGEVDCDDLAIVRASFGRRSSAPSFDPSADTNSDGIVNVRDLAFVAQQLPAGLDCP